MAACIAFLYAAAMLHNGSWPSLAKWNHVAIADSIAWRDYDGWQCLKKRFAKAHSSGGERRDAFTFDEPVVCPTTYPWDLRPHLAEAIKRDAVFVRRIVAEIRRDGLIK
jgi:hypothetical protein